MSKKPVKKDLRDLHPPPNPSEFFGLETPKRIVSRTRKRVTPKKTHRVTIRLDAYHFYDYESHANKMNTSIADLFKVAIYHFLYKTFVPTMEITRLKKKYTEDRASKGLMIKTTRQTKPIAIRKSMSEQQKNMVNVLNELKKFDVNNLKKVPESEKKHIYNIFAKKDN